VAVEVTVAIVGNIVTVEITGNFTTELDINIELVDKVGSEKVDGPGGGGRGGPPAQTVVAKNASVATERSFILNRDDARDGREMHIYIVENIKGRSNT
jgi:hypothetical protein